MAVVRRKDKRTGGVAWLSVTTAILEIECDTKKPDHESAARLVHGEVIETPFYVYEGMV